MYQSKLSDNLACTAHDFMKFLALKSLIDASKMVDKKGFLIMNASTYHKISTQSKSKAATE